MTSDLNVRLLVTQIVIFRATQPHKNILVFLRELRSITQAWTPFVDYLLGVKQQF
jgi:hypothetical protein